MPLVGDGNTPARFGVCTGMTGRIATVDQDVAEQAPVDDTPAEAVASDDAIDERLRETIEAIRPAVQADGGDIFFHGIDDRGVVTVELVGACVSCPASTLTLKAGVERILKDRVPGVTSVISLGENDETVVSL